MDLELCVLLKYANAECLSRMPMCNVTFIGKHKHSQSAQPNDTNSKTFELPIVHFGLMLAYLISQWDKMVS